MAGRKRANGEGSISQHPDGRWWARVTLPNGKRKAFYGKSRKEVQQKLTAALSDQQKGLPIVGERQTVAEYLAWWLETSKRPRLRPRTWERYVTLVRLHVVPHVGGVALGRLTPQQLADMYRKLLAAGLSKRTVQFVHAVLHGALKQAVRLELVARNPADAVDAPRPERREMHALTAEQARMLLDAVRGDRLEAFYVLAVSTGMRLGELLGLRWRDLDLDAGRLHVRSTLQRVNSQWLFAEPKTQQSRRSISLSAVAVAALRAHRARQLETVRELGPAWISYDLVFCGPTGEPLHATNFGKQYFHSLLKRAGLPRIRPHDLRHTTASILLAGNVHPKYVQDLLGHSQISMTLDTYSHITQNMQEQVAAHMDAVLAAQ
jgi:integrase